jgi:hypothetical protein
MLTWGQLGAYLSVLVTVLAGGLSLCWYALWRQ